MTFRVDEQAAREWALSTPKWYSSLKNAVLYRWYHIDLTFDFSEVRLIPVLFGTIRVFLVVGIAGFPAFDSWLRTGAVPTRDAVSSILILSVMLFAAWSIDRHLNRNRSQVFWKNEEERLAGNLAGAIKDIADHTKPKTNQRAQTVREDAARKILKCIQHRMAQITMHKGGGYFSVTLMLFHNDGHEDKTLIFQRSKNEPDRPINIWCDTNIVAAYHVAKCGKRLKALHNLTSGKLFPPRRLSTVEYAPYRSILTIPLPFQEVNGTRRCLGAVTVDSSKPYEFWPLEEKLVLTLIFPFLEALNLLVSGIHSGVEVEK